MENQLIIECSGNHAGKGMGGVVAVGNSRAFLYRGGENMMSIKELDTWNGRNTLEDIEALGVDPLLALMKIIDEVDELSGNEAQMVYMLNRAVYEGLTQEHKRKAVNLLNRLTAPVTENATCHKSVTNGFSIKNRESASSLTPCYHF